MAKLMVFEVIRQGQIDGEESHLLDLIYYLDKEKVESVCLSFTDGEMIHRLKQMGITCHVIESQKPFDIRVLKQVLELILEEGVQLVHAHGSRVASNILFPVKKLHLPLVYTVHGQSFHDDQSPLVKKLLGQSEKIICYYANQVICVSQSNKDTGREVFGLKDAQVICTKQKNPIVFFESLLKARAANPSVKGLFVGEGDMNTEVDAFIQQHQMQGYIYRSPFRTDVPDLLHCIDVYCLPSLWEGLSIALLEAIAMRKAIIDRWYKRSDGT